jgi:hypothetical protein
MFVVAVAWLGVVPPTSCRILWWPWPGWGWCPQHPAESITLFTGSVSTILSLPINIFSIESILTSHQRFPIREIENRKTHGEGGKYRYRIRGSTSTKYFLVFQRNDIFSESCRKESHGFNCLYYQK